MRIESPSLTDADREALVRTRRDLHRHPELGMEEHRTAGIAAERLRAAGYEVATGVGRTGVVGVLACGEGPCLMLRADMDALPVQEVAGRAYGSTVDGVMHACGHDGHVATLLTVADVLARERDRLRGTLKLVFQPGEEGHGGARAMIADGVLEDPRVDTAVGLHYWSLQPTGTVGATPGAVMASVDTFDLTIHGVGGHAAIPHEARDALVAAAYVVTALQTVVSRGTDPLQPVVVTVGELHAGTVFNVIPGEARLAGTVRTFDPELWERIPADVERVIRGVCEAHGCTYELDYRRVDGPTINDPEVAALVREVGVELVGADRVIDNRTMGGEDMSEYLLQVPGCFFFVGARDGQRGITAAHHHPAFDLDEDALAIGAEMLVRVARRTLAG